ncbi:MAG: hypothetical protein OXH20_03580 [bacterium]|nr:hypothetical protein [bacterium]MDE0667640.1 hypothetical protein [bacterium]MXZ30263.1 hypothetical protein [Acidimicrobiia bacterium]MYB23770.1 hypothetical protein [Acidimicrobiia bacterium]MYJ14253.1 hypothetical protein [Acidimicrobiia bacterium]
MSGPEGPATARSALPGRRARALATLAILLAGACGGLIGYALVDVSCSGDCGWQLGLGTLVGAVASAAGVAVVTSLTLRAMHEWRTAPRAAASPRTRRGPARRT